MPKKEKKETVVFGLRLNIETMKELDTISKKFKTDKSELIRDAIEDFIDASDKEIIDLAIDDFVHARIDEERFLIITGLKEISDDLKKARKEIIDKIKKGEN